MQQAVLYRMNTGDHICPFGIKSKDLLEKEGFKVTDHKLKNREQVDQFKEKYSVKTTPQTFIGDQRIGGYEDLVKYFNKTTLKQEGTTYQPIIAIFSSTFIMALAFIYSKGTIALIPFLESFIAISMCVLAILKLRDLYSFSNQFVTYDLLAKRYVNYSYIYPFAEFLAGVGMIASLLTPVVALTSIFIGTIGGISVIKAVYIEKRDIKCACVGGDSNVPLGFISLTENMMMLGMGLWMLFSKVL
ncbi:MAG: glutaredoxin family protein [Halobacteriovoraceae bacterium]|nr:glutaredoxin family protein [Halobacteriovoraceae bacterium]|tara:strand:+ start:2606 stop:3340 length:735 start_codon:yes stop_codon:yes gene_type:complete